MAPEPTVPAPAAAPLAASLAADLAAVLRGWHWRHTGLGIVLGVLCLVYMGAPLLPGAGDREWFTPLAYNILQFGLPIVLAVRLADRALDRGRPAWLAYGTAVAAVVTAGVWLIGPALMPVLGSSPHWTIANDLWLAVGIGVVFALGVAVHAHRRASWQALARAREREAARARRQQALQAARLLALQAQVEPQLLFHSLQHVQGLIDAGRTDTADALLAELIALLRALLPDDGARCSTLGRELALAAAQARLAEATGRPLPALQAELEDGMAEAPLAPMLLSELLRALAHAPALRWRLQARRSASGTSRLQFGPATAAPESAAQHAQHAQHALQALDLAPLQRRLQDVHGPAARLQRGDDCLTLEIPPPDDHRPDR